MIKAWRRRVTYKAWGAATRTNDRTKAITYPWLHSRRVVLKKAVPKDYKMSAERTQSLAIGYIELNLAIVRLR